MTVEDFADEKSFWEIDIQFGIGTRFGEEARANLCAVVRHPKLVVRASKHQEMALNPGKPKENANPTILSVHKGGRSHAKRTPFDWAQLGTFEKTGDDWIPTTAGDVAIHRALIDTANASRGKSVALLQNAGLSIPTYTTSATVHVPTFTFSNPEETKTDSGSSECDTPVESTRDRMTAEEVFDIIRTIQDPEHPNTLEELGVVSLEQVEVIDEEVSTHVAGTPYMKSVVNVRFT
eukprot:scaffold1203_cov117-Cylindrotheca_fusiformis.AAC.4